MTDISTKQPVTAGLALAAICFILDQLSKLWILDLMSPPRIIDILPFFNLVLAYNPGVSFGFLNGGAIPPWGFSLFSVAVAAGMFYWMRRTPTRIGRYGLGMIIGGALGNALDRLTYGAVVDFLDFFWNNMHWPAFNLADSFITIGVVFLLIDSFYTTPSKEMEKS